MSEQATEPKPLAGLTSLRFFAACYVLLYHTRGGVWFRAGNTGVTLFFVLSGFILAYNHPVVRPGQRFRFYVARFARIYPLYLVSFLLMAPLAIRSGGHSKAYLVTGSALYVLLLQTWVPPFHWVISAGSWTMPVETFFYAVFPFFVVWMAKFQRRWMLTVGLLWAGLLMPSMVADVFWMGARPGSEEFLHQALSVPVFHLGEFLIGIVLGLRYLHHRPVFRGGAVLAATAFCIAGLAAIGPLPGRYGEIALNGSMAVPYGLLIYAIAGWNSRVLAHPLLQLGGEISYSIYLLQWFFVDTVQRLMHGSRAFAPLRFGAFLLLAYLSYQLIEKPARRGVLRLFGVRSHPKPIETPAAGLP